MSNASSHRPTLPDPRADVEDRLEGEKLWPTLVILLGATVQAVWWSLRPELMPSKTAWIVWGCLLVVIGAESTAFMLRRFATSSHSLVRARTVALLGSGFAAVSSLIAMGLSWNFSEDIFARAVTTWLAMVWCGTFTRRAAAAHGRRRGPVPPTPREHADAALSAPSTQYRGRGA